jgi:hypothetical protein
MSEAPFHAQTKTEQILGFHYAYIGEQKVMPLTLDVAYYGNQHLQPHEVDQHSGLPATGDDLDLIRHKEPPPQRERPSAFRGTVPFPLSPCGDAGAALWAQEGGCVVEIQSYPGYDINQLLEGKVPNGRGGFRDPLHPLELESAIPGRVPLAYITRLGVVAVNSRGKPRVDWQ